MIFEAKEGRETAERSSVAVEGVERRIKAKVFEVEVNFFSGNLSKKWILRHEVRLSGEPGEEAVEIGKIVFDGYLREGFIFGSRRFKKETTKVV